MYLSLTSTYCASEGRQQRKNRAKARALFFYSTLFLRALSRVPALSLFPFPLLSLSSSYKTLHCVLSNSFWFRTYYWATSIKRGRRSCRPRPTARRRHPSPCPARPRSPQGAGRCRPPRVRSWRWRASPCCFRWVDRFVQIRPKRSRSLRRTPPRTGRKYTRRTVSRRSNCDFVEGDGWFSDWG